MSRRYSARIRVGKSRRVVSRLLLTTLESAGFQLTGSLRHPCVSSTGLYARRWKKSTESAGINRQGDKEKGRQGEKTTVFLSLSPLLLVCRHRRLRERRAGLGAAGAGGGAGGSLACS